MEVQKTTQVNYILTKLHILTLSGVKGSKKVKEIFRKGKDLDSIIGSEQRRFRPVLILQNDIGNKYIH